MNIMMSNGSAVVNNFLLDNVAKLQLNASRYSLDNKYLSIYVNNKWNIIFYMDFNLYAAMAGYFIF